MGITSPFSASTFSHIYQKALQSQLVKIGNNLAAIRTSRKEEILSVANAMNLRPEVLQRIENGQQDFRIKTLFALCDYYNVEVASIVNQGELLYFWL